MSDLQHVRLTIDGNQIEVHAGTILIDAARKAGVSIPSLCFLPGHPSRGVCRVCSVSVSGRRGLVPACATAAVDGMEVQTQLQTVKRARRVLIELALAEHGPCKEDVCGGEKSCQLNRLAHEHGVTEKRFEAIEKPVREELSSDSIRVRPDGCILCDRCIQACRDLRIIGRAGLGQGTHIVFDADRSMDQSDCVACGDCVAVCPVDVFK